MCSVYGGSGCEGSLKGCCTGSLWNASTQQCERCMPGYSGVNCSLKCPYPYYGTDCQRTCKCSRDLCDVSTGCIDLTTEKDTSVSTSIYEENTISLAMENSTIPYLENTLLTEKNQTDEINELSSTANDNIILCIRILGCVDILLICMYSAVCIYDRQHWTLDMVDSNENVPRNNSTYENVEIFFLSPTGNQSF